MRGGAVGVAFCLIALAGLCAQRSDAELAAAGNLRVSFSGELKPRVLPRAKAAPISVRIGGRIFTTDKSDPPSLERIEIALNRDGRIDPKALPSCTAERIQPATTETALRVCGAAKVGEGSFSAAVAIPGQAPFPSRGDVTAFNGREHGRPVILLHIFGTEPVPTSLTVPLRITRGKGQFGTVLRGDLPSVDSNVGFVTGISLRLGGGRRSRPYLAAGCPALDGSSLAVFSLARVSFAFAGTKTLRSTLLRSCRAIG
jgi:hypothetical protein